MHSTSAYHDVLQKTLGHALAHLEHLDDHPASAPSSLTELRNRLVRPLEDAGMAPGQVIDEMVADVAGGLSGNPGGRFYAWVVGGSVPAALAADWLTATWDQNAALYACAPAAAVIEEACGAWLKELLCLPDDASFALVTGCQAAHLTCLAAARNHLLNARGWDVEQQGLHQAPPVRIVCGDQRHGTVERAVRLLGLGRDAFVDVAVDADGRVTPDTLERALAAEPDTATIVSLQAGNVDTGAYDAFESLIPIAHRHGAWVHVDGAFGLWVGVSDRYRDLVAGVGTADSWATDGHKWLNVPYDSGYAFVAHPEPHRASMSHRAAYLTHDEDARDQMDWNPEWSRRGRGVATYAAIRQLGRSGIAEIVERTCAHAAALVQGIAALPGTEVVWEPTINQGLVRFLAPDSLANDTDHDQHTQEIIDNIAAGGEAFFSGTTWQGMRCMRVSVSSWQTTAADVQRSVTAVQRALESHP
jgi:glutamate/tyrosine decarboxylase-like PLP-dependent enzyme